MLLWKLSVCEIPSSKEVTANCLVETQEADHGGDGYMWAD